jgi:RNA polymerase sigma-70 factor (ECF subfamily)
VDVPQEVIAACQRGEAEAFEELVRLTHQDVYSLALRIVSNREDAADVTQDTYLKLLRAIRTFRGDSKFSTWLYRVTSSVAISHLRRNARRRGDVPLEAEGVAELPSLTDTGGEAERRELKHHLEEALSTLPLGYRAVVVMKDIYGFPLVEIGRQLGITEGAAKVRLFRARQRLKDTLSEEAPLRRAQPRRQKKRGVS